MAEDLFEDEGVLFESPSEEATDEDLALEAEVVDSLQKGEEFTAFAEDLWREQREFE